MKIARYMLAMIVFGSTTKSSLSVTGHLLRNDSPPCTVPKTIQIKKIIIYFIIIIKTITYFKDFVKSKNRITDKNIKV